MKSAEQVKQEFILELKALFIKYNAELVAENNWTGYAECGENIQVTISIPATYTDKEELTEASYFTIGKYFPV